jgi:hypothetical protein
MEDIGFQKHPSITLNELYRVKNYQGTNPTDAMVLFVGKDPNWAIDIEEISIFNLVKEYLQDGISFWRKHDAHHPFLHPEYKGDGKKYHNSFSRINLPKDFADKISFIEIIGFPTTGMSSKKPALFNKYLLSDENRKHLIHLDTLLSDPNKLIFSYWGLIDQMKYINFKIGLFKEFASIDKSLMSGTDLNKVGNLYFHKHFSMGISQETLNKIGSEIGNYNYYD